MSVLLNAYAFHTPTLCYADKPLNFTGACMLNPLALFVDNTSDDDANIRRAFFSRMFALIRMVGG